VALDRRVLARALTLGCVMVRITPGRPVVFEGKDKTLVTAALDPSLAVEPADPADVTTTHTSERRTAVKRETNGHAPDGRHDPPAVAEELRAALADAVTRAGRLVAALKYKRKQQRALTQVWSSLRALNLGPGGHP